MLYETRLKSLRRNVALRTVVRFAAGVHAANGVAHGVPPTPGSPARAGHFVGSAGSASGCTASSRSGSKRTLTR